MSGPLDQQKLIDVYNRDSSTTGDQNPVHIRLLDVVIDEKHKPKLSYENGRVQVFVEADANGVKTDNPIPNPEIILIDPAKSKTSHGSEASAFYPQGVATSFPPKKDDLFEDKGGDMQSVIFGPDDRIVFHDTSYPWRLTGKVQTAAGRGSGCMIGPRHVLTASHCVNWAADGSAGWITFSPGYYNGPGPWGTFTTTLIYSYMKNIGALSDEQTAFDYVVLVLDKRIGDTIGWAGGKNFDQSWVNTVKWTSVGYPGDLTGTERPVYQGNVVITSKQDFTFNGRSGSVLGHFSDITGGMSGGPIWGTWANEVGPQVVGVCSTREGPPIANPTGSTDEDNEYGGGAALVSLINQARTDSA